MFSPEDDPCEVNGEGIRKKELYVQCGLIRENDIRLDEYALGGKVERHPCVIRVIQAKPHKKLQM